MSIDLEDKPYSPGQIAISTWDKDTNRVRVDAEVTAIIGELAVDLDSSNDSVSIGNTNNNNTLDVNADGSINTVAIIQETEVEYDYDSASVAISATSTILSKTFLIDKKIKTVCLSGDNLGKYTVSLNGNVISTLRTTWTNYNVQLSLDCLKVFTGDVLEVIVINNNTSIADFNATIIYQNAS